MATWQDFIVTKADGTVEPFSWDKLARSLKRSSVNDEQVDELERQLHASLPHQVETGTIRRDVQDYLRKNNGFARARYTIRDAIMKLGPDGFGFEKYLAAIWRKLGYEATTGQILNGKCVTHEVDVVAWRGDEYELFECKYHNSFGAKSDVKIALYVSARFADIGSVWDQYFPGKHFKRGRLATNTKVTSDALQYAQCQQLEILSWNYPAGESLRELIDKTHLFPITSSSHLSREHLALLLSRNIVTCEDLMKAHPHDLAELPKHTLDRIYDDIAQMCLAAGS